MSAYHYNLFFIFFVLFALVIIDPNVGRLIDLVIKIISINYEKIKWIIVNDPNNPIVKYMIWRRSMKLAEQMMDEITKSKNQ